MASSSRQTLEDQPRASASSQASVDNNITDSDLYGMIRALTNTGLISSNFNLFGSASTNDNVVNDTSSLSDTNPSSTATRSTPNDTSSLTDTNPTSTPSASLPNNIFSDSEGSDATERESNKRSLPSDLEESDLPLKRQKTD